jgi:hypothetical protein
VEFTLKKCWIWCSTMKNETDDFKQTISKRIFSLQQVGTESASCNHGHDGDSD